MGQPISVRPGTTGPFNDDNPYDAGGDSWGSLVTINKGPNLLEWTRRGYVYSTVTSPAAPCAYPIYSTATNSPTLWNPEGSGKLVVPIRINMGVAAIVTYLDNAFLLAQTLNTGSAVATGGVFATFTNIAPYNMLIGGPSGKAKYAGAVVTWTVQPTVIMTIGMSTWAAGTEANLEYSWLHYEFDGHMALPPGSAISLVGVVASSTTFVTSFVFAELPLPAAMP